MTRHLTLDDLLFIASQACGKVHVRDYGLLESALARPAATVFGSDAYPTLHTKAAALLHSLASNHTLVDGNKRLAWAACAVFLGINGHRPHASQDEVVHLVVSIADGTLTDIDKIAERLAAWSTPAGASRPDDLPTQCPKDPKNTSSRAVAEQEACG